MDLLGLFTIPTWLVILILIVTALYLYFTWTFGTLEAMGLPTPKPVPFFGNLYREVVNRLHDEDMRNAKLYGKTYGFYFTRIPMIRTSDPDFIKEVCIKEFNCFTDHMRFDLRSVDPIMNRFITQLSGDEWRHTRNLLTPSFTSGKLKQMMPLIDKCANELTGILGELADSKQSFELKDKYMAYLTDVIATCAFGMEINSQRSENHEFVKHARNLVAQQNIFLVMLAFIIPAPILKFLKIQIMSPESMRFFKKVILDIIECRQSNKMRRNDFLQLMLDAIEDKSEQTDPNQPKKLLLSQDTVVAQSVLFLFAGFETTGSTLTYVTYNIATHPECQEKLYNEIREALDKSQGKIDYEMLSQMQYLDMVIHETLRMYPPAIRTDRQCTKDCVINGMPIKKDILIAINIYAVMRDEDYFENPNEFIPERFSPEAKDGRNPLTFLAFGAGPRNCIGMRFALMEMKYTLVHLMKNFRFVVAEDTQVPIQFLKGRFNLAPEKPVRLKLERRN